MEGTRRKFDAAFKREALRLAQETNRKLVPAMETLCKHSSYDVRIEFSFDC